MVETGLLAHSLGIQLHNREFATLMARGTPLPASRTERLRTTGALRRTDFRQAIRIPVVQGERRRADRNHEVGVVLIRARDLRADLPEGAEVEVTFTVAAGLDVSVAAPGVRVRAEFDFSPPRAQAPEVVEILLVEAQERLDELRASGSPEAARGLAALESSNAMGIAWEEMVAARADPSAAWRAEERLRDIQSWLDDIEDAVGITRQVHDLRELIGEAERLCVAHGGSKERLQLAALTVRARAAIRNQDPAAVRTQTERAVELVVELERRAPDWPVKLFYAALGSVPASGEATRLITEGDRAVRAGDMRALAAVNQRLLRLCAPRPRAEMAGSIGVAR
ncbi:hypothetical protein [Kutzneria sp. NPDC052558]|uniref:hypothetical protein n=1 Tax=Kutzneria sp. NPDC052558 TaxID=3364121 RepID=UPI0037C9D904